MPLKKGFVLKFEEGEINLRRDGLDRGVDLVSGVVDLDLHLAGVQKEVRVGEDALAVNNNAGSDERGGRTLVPGLDKIGIARGGVNLDDRFSDDIRFVGDGGSSSGRRSGGLGLGGAIEQNGEARRKKEVSKLHSVLG